MSAGGKFAKYKDAIKALSVRTGTPVPSLVVSFAVLHEISALVPLVGGFYTARALGIGETVVHAIENTEDAGWMRHKAKIWLNEGEAWAERVGRRYGYFGFVKGSKANAEGASTIQEASHGQAHVNLAGDIANAVVAFGAVKALLPIRVGLSLYLSPAFSRGIIEPLRIALIRPFKKP